MLDINDSIKIHMNVVHITHYVNRDLRLFWYPRYLLTVLTAEKWKFSNSKKAFLLHVCGCWGEWKFIRFLNRYLFVCIRFCGRFKAFCGFKVIWNFQFEWMIAAVGCCFIIYTFLVGMFGTNRFIFWTRQSIRNVPYK